ncbi:CPBP family intramembrane glutamic endopeptidase [Leptolyngbya sp. AN03gr2]|uniref:CPBP family intramembrane glutamic endopeptidase n=1 Tax=unclassified Leptolyngbya TaxID=2650499 RepID=UPI003D31ABC0
MIAPLLNLQFPISIDAVQFVNAFSQTPAFVQIGIFFLAWGLIWLPIAIPISIWVKWKPFNPLELQQKLPLVASLYILAPLILWGVAILKRVPFSSFGINLNANLFASVGTGFAIGVVGILILFGIQTALGWLHWKFENWRKWISASVPTLLLGVWIGFTEELVFRGFFFGQLGADFWTSAIVSSVVFALLHLIWEGKDNIPQLPGLTLMGVVLCLAFVQNQNSIGLAWGLHAGWIWMIASLDAAEILQYEETAPEWFTGIDRKPLAGLLGLLFLLGTGFAIVKLI